MSRTACRFFSSSLRTSARANLSTAARSPRAALTRRMMSSESHPGHGSTSSDTPWMIGSALMFGPLFLYLVSPSARKGSHGHDDTDHGHKSHRDEHEDKHVQHVESRRVEDAHPIADDEGTEVSGQEVKESMEKAFEADSPTDAQNREEVVVKAETAVAEDNSAPEAHPGAESSTDGTPVPESEPNSTPSAVVVDDTTPAATNEKTLFESTPESQEEGNEPAGESKA